METDSRVQKTTNVGVHALCGTFKRTKNTRNCFDKENNTLIGLRTRNLEAMNQCGGFEMAKFTKHDRMNFVRVLK